MTAKSSAQMSIEILASLGAKRLAETLIGAWGCAMRPKSQAADTGH